MNYLQLLFLVSAFLGVYGNFVTFRSTVIYDQDPHLSGLLTGQMLYQYDLTVGSNHHWVQVAYQDPVHLTEMIDYSRSIRSRYCDNQSTCDTETYTQPAPQYFLLATDVLTGQQLDGCDEYLRHDGVIDRLWLNGDRLCQVTLQVPTGPTRLKFINYRTVDVVSPSVPSEWQCPEPVCNRKMDWVLVLDESGSITDASWAQAKSFATNIVQSFVVSEEATHLGLVLFSTVARTLVNLTTDPNYLVSTLNATQQTKEFTCIGCGLSNGVQVLQWSVRQVPQLMLIVTDGVNNRPLEIYNEVLAQSIVLAQNAGIFTIAVGVGSQVNQAELERIASSYQGVKQVFYTDSYATLPSLIEHLVSVSCTILNPQPCGDQCYGFCGCDRQCVCPQCPPSDACVIRQCDPFYSDLGCVDTPVDCSVDDVCQIPRCDPIIGCQYTPVVCEDNQVCDPVIGCHTQECPVTDACHRYTYHDTLGCVLTPVNCTVTNRCLVASCHPVNGCQYTPVDCNDCDATTIDTCDPLIGCQHQSDPCRGGPTPPDTQVIRIDINVHSQC